MAALARSCLRGVGSSPVKHLIKITGTRQVKTWVAPLLRELYKRRQKVGPPPPIHRSAMLNWNLTAELYAFGKRLNETFNDDALRTAFTHRSYVDMETQKRKELGVHDVAFKMIDNTQLINDGERLIAQYVAAYLRHTHPYFPEEGIRAVQEFLMSDDILSHVSSNIGTSDLILCEEFQPSSSTLAKTFKAIVAAIMESRGTVRAELFVQDFLLTQLIGRDVNEMWTIENPMGLLMDILVRERRPLPESRLVRESGRNTLFAVYNVGVYSDRRFMGLGFGETLAIAEEMAARDALKTLFRTTQREPPLPFGHEGRDLGIDFDKVNPSCQVWTTELAENHAQQKKLSRKSK